LKLFAQQIHRAEIIADPHETPRTNSRPKPGKPCLMMKKSPGLETQLCLPSDGRSPA
jgi:hypothetical protein